MISDYLNGPSWILWIVFGLIASLSILLLSGHGAGLIAGYNTARRMEKEEFDRKKLCRVVGMFLAVIALFILAMAIWNEVLPIAFVYVFMGVIVIGAIITVVLLNTVCRIRKR